MLTISLLSSVIQIEGYLVDLGVAVMGCMLTQDVGLCHSLQDVEGEQHFVFDCPAYNHIRIKHADLFQQTFTVPEFIARCEPNACGGFLTQYQLQS